MKKLDRLFIRIVDFTLRFPKSVLLASLLVTAISIYFTNQIKIRSNFSDLLPDNHPSVIQAKELEKQVGGASFIVLAIETNSAKNASIFLDELRSGLTEEGLEGIRYIDDRPPTEFLKKSALLYLSLEELDGLKKDILRKIDQEKLKKARLYIDFEEDKEHFSSFLGKAQRQYPTFIPANNLYQNNEGNLFVALIKPEWQTTDVARTQVFLEKLDRVIARIKPEKFNPPLSLRYTGPYVKTLTQKKIMIRDATLISIISFLAAIAYLFFHFRKKRAVLLIGIPLMMSVTWSTSLAYFFFGSLNLFSSAASAILLGLAADYGIHLYSEYTRHRKAGQAAPEALRFSVCHLGRAFLAASSTTASAFFALMFSRFKALFEMGMLAGSGVILCVIAFLLLFPPLTLLIERRWPEKIVIKEWSDTRVRFSKKWTHWIFSPKNLVASLLFLLLPLITLAAGRLKFDYNLNHIMGQQTTKELDRRVDNIFNHTVNPEVLMADRPEDAGKLATVIRNIEIKNKKTPQGSTIKGTVALPDFIPSYQEAKIEKIHEIRSLFSENLVRHFNPEEKKTYDDFRGMLSPQRVRLSNLPSQITNKFIDKNGKLGRIVFIFPNFEMTQADRFMRFVEELREIRCPDCAGSFYVSGESSVFYDIVKMLFREGKYIIGFATLSVLFAFFANFRTPFSALRGFAPLVVGLLATLGWMGLTGIPFNIINLAAIPIILGTADDYAVHFYQAYLDHPERSLLETYQRTFRPILGSMLTTLIGFGSLLLADMGGIRTFGTLCVLGILLCGTTTLLWFPALLKFTGGRKGVSFHLQ